MSAEGVESSALDAANQRAQRWLDRHDKQKSRAESALDLARRILAVHAEVQMDTPEDKALHARACRAFEAAIAAVAGTDPP